MAGLLVNKCTDVYCIRIRRCQTKLRIIFRREVRLPTWHFFLVPNVSVGTQCPRSSFPTSRWERRATKLRFGVVAAPRRVTDAKRSLAALRSQAELGNEDEDEAPLRRIKHPMSRDRYRIGDPCAAHFFTGTIVAWLPLFTRPEAAQIILDSLKFNHTNNRFTLFGYV